MDYSLLNGIGSYLMLGQGNGIQNGISSYLTNPYMVSPYLLGTYSSGLMSQAGISNVFQSGVRFGQALEKAKDNNPESAEQLQKALEEAFGSKGSGKTAATGSSGKESAAAVYEPSYGNVQRSHGSLESYLEGRRASRLQQRQVWGRRRAETEL